MVLEHGPEHGSQWEAIRSVAGKIGCSAEALRVWVRRSEIDSGRRKGVTSDEQTRVYAAKKSPATEVGLN